MISDSMANYFNDLADVGAGWRRRKRRRPAGSMNARRLIPNVPGVPARGLREQPLPLGLTTFTATSGTALTLRASPERPFRGRRLVIDLTRNGTTGGLVTVTSITVGADNQLPTGIGSMPVSMFASNAVGVDLDMDPATPGVNIVVGLGISSAPTGTDTVDVSGGIIGEAAA